MFTKIEQIKNLLDELSTELDALRSRFTGFGNVVRVDGREWFVLQPNASARIVSENCMAEGNIGTFNAWYLSPELNALLTIKGT